ncbi:hypothetical protein DYQ86_04010 [Acidobacteria bacterium AB60]|nr:hypothetical protein DYQ86_04010 [Acidobacteria bacterium AB60]
MKPSVSIPLLLLPCALAIGAAAQTSSVPESRTQTRYSIGVIDDATFYAGLPARAPATLNRLLLEPSLGLKLDNRLTLSTSLIEVSTTRDHTASQVLVREGYAGLSAGDFDLTAGRKMVRWGTGYAFTAAGVLDPPRIPTDPSDRLNLNEGRDMVKVDWIHGPHALSAAWSTAALARSGTHMRDTAAFRYNVLVHGFDTALIAGNDRGGDSFGALTFTRVMGQAWEIHGEAAWREQAAVLLGAKYTMASGVTFIGEFFTPPNTPYFSSGVPLSAGRQHYAFVNAGKTRLRELPGWKEWDVSAGMVANLDDHSTTGVADVNRWFGKHVSAYLHLEVPNGSRNSQYGAAPYTAATSLGLRFQL